jgi:hypothetical protein
MVRICGTKGNGAGFDPRAAETLSQWSCDLSDHTEKKSKSQRTCFARRHMKPGPYALYDYAYKVSHAKNNPTGVFWSNNRGHAKELGVSPATVNEWMHLLVEQNWFQCLDDGPRRRSKKTGYMMPVRYSVLDHDEWSALHPAKCYFAEAAPQVWRKRKNKPKPVTETRSGPVQETRSGDSATWSSFPDSPDTVLPFSPDTETRPKTEKCFKTEESKTEPFIAKVQRLNSPSDRAIQSEQNRFQIEKQLCDIAIPKLQSALKGVGAGNSFPLAPIKVMVGVHADQLGLLYAPWMLDDAFAAAMDHLKITQVPGSGELSALQARFASLERNITAIDAELAKPDCRDKLWNQSHRRSLARERAKFQHSIEECLQRYPHLNEAKTG